LDTAVSGVISTTPSIALINASVVGDDFDNRDGRSIRIKSVQIALTVFFNASATQTATRMMVVIDKQPNETLLVIGDLITATNSHAMRNLDQRKRFVILWDRVVTQGDQENAPRHIEFYKKLDMITVYDDSNAGTIADIETNALYLILFSTEATNTPTVGRTTRVRFIDN